jgi:hypothetical protein
MQNNTFNYPNSISIEEDLNSLNLKDNAGDIEEYEMINTCTTRTIQPDYNEKTRETERDESFTFED